jgi:hypothetical protein
MGILHSIGEKFLVKIWFLKGREKLSEFAKILEIY